MNKAQNNYEVAMAQQRINQEKQDRAMARGEAKQTVAHINATEAQRLKEERAQHEEMIRLQKNAEVAKAQTMKQMVRNQKDEQVAMRKQEKELKRQQQRLDLIR